jgi:hypothetical protein
VGRSYNGFTYDKRPVSDLPRFALAEVAWHLLEGLSDPSFKEGMFFA